MMRALPAAAVVLALAAGCSSSSGKNDAGPGGGGATGAVRCDLINSDGSNHTDCACGSTGTNSLAECSAASAAATDHGYCCSGGGFCDCFRTACMTLAYIGFCKCGSPIDDTSPRVDSCPQVPNSICCLDTRLYPYSCHCSDGTTGCLAGETQVASCTVADVMFCRASEAVVDRCK